MKKPKKFDWLTYTLKLSAKEREALAEKLEAAAAAIRATVRPLSISPERKQWSPSEN